MNDLAEFLKSFSGKQITIAQTKNRDSGTRVLSPRGPDRWRQRREVGRMGNQALGKGVGR